MAFNLIDKNNNQNIVDKADFLISSGFGKMRFYNNILQYYNTSTETWVDVSLTQDNEWILNMIPKEMKSITGVFDNDICKFKLKWEEPEDTIVGDETICIVDKVIIRRKLGSVPIDENDGDLVITVKRKDFNKHIDTYYTDNLSPGSGDTYFYKAFPMSTMGFCNYSSVNETVGLTYTKTEIYGFKIDQNESDPASMITYLEDCDNASFASAYMDYEKGVFNYGDWSGAWFIRNIKPCMLKYDGTVDYYLQPNDYSKKLDGTDSDISNTSYEGNAMIGIPKVYWKIVDNGDNTANVYISESKIYDDYVCWSHIDNNGNEIDYCYMPIYNGSLVNGKLRSLSNQIYPIYNQTPNTEVDYAKANNLTDDTIWYTEVLCDRQLINLLLLLIGKSTDTQTVFGNGYCSGGSSSNSLLQTGVLNNKGLFYGENGTKTGVKIFGMENYWGNQYRRIAGLINYKGTQKVKMTYGMSDGSTVEGYNFNGDGYLEVENSTPSGTSGGYISKIIMGYYGLLPTISDGSSTTYYCDGLWIDNSRISYAFVGGNSVKSFRIGMLCSVLANDSSYACWDVGASISCKPLASTK